MDTKMPSVVFVGSDIPSLRGRSHLNKEVRNFLKVHQDAHKLALELPTHDIGPVLRLVIWEEDMSICDVLEFSFDPEKMTKFFKMHDIDINHLKK